MTTTVTYVCVWGTKGRPEQTASERTLRNLHETTHANVVPDSLWAMAYGHSSGLPSQEPPVMIAEKRNLFFS